MDNFNKFLILRDVTQLGKSASRTEIVKQINCLLNTSYSTADIEFMQADKIKDITMQLVQFLPEVTQEF